MFSKDKGSEPGTKKAPATAMSSPPATEQSAGSTGDVPAAMSVKAKPPASILSSDLAIVGNVKTTGDIQVDGTIEGDIRAHMLTIGEAATIKGEVVADDIVINGRIQGRVRGLKVRLTSSARVEGDIVHKSIAIESGAHFEGTVHRQDDPLSGTGSNARQGGGGQRQADVAAGQRNAAQ